MEFKKHWNRILLHILSMPFIYVMIVIFVAIDISFEIYHRVCFLLYRIPYIKRSDYIRIDRHKLKYLNIWEKLNCMYCGYANGLMGYATAIVGATEGYWCGIKHGKKNDDGFVEPSHHEDFLPYGDENAYKDFLGK